MCGSVFYYSREALWLILRLKLYNTHELELLDCGMYCRSDVRPPCRWNVKLATPREGGALLTARRFYSRVKELSVPTWTARRFCSRVEELCVPTWSIRRYRRHEPANRNPSYLALAPRGGVDPEEIETHFGVQPHRLRLPTDRKY